eukprot:TRINITY_DN60168_c0_g1_i1.p1 TRINITY_DN60168_c0_g1~~TRINITY_DN60168_c0_g1_i1.p1  ORF type:complete len:376 (+),score=40.70 TRINITY_DN60168_c0_g1_i1:55-1182(+)
MPLFEEKLISPFAIRFTQEHIRTTFRDGRAVEQTVTEIETQPGKCDVDLILKAPFPHIEIIRWTSADGDHWFSFDNRRLYCLQRAAAAHWPRRVACVVEVPYAADRSSWWRKCDTSVAGGSVSLRHSSMQPAVSSWDWRDAIQEQTGTTMTVAFFYAAGLANQAVLDDDAKASIDDLTNPSDHGILSRCTPCPQAVMTELQNRAEESNTACTDPNESDQDTQDKTPRHEPAAANASVSKEDMIRDSMKCTLNGWWEGEKGEAYNLVSDDALAWTCSRAGIAGKKKFTVRYDPESNLIWWGTSWKYYMDPSDACGQPEQIVWYAGGDMKKSRPKFRWYRWSEQSAPLSGPKNARIANTSYSYSGGKQGYRSWWGGS